MDIIIEILSPSEWGWTAQTYCAEADADYYTLKGTPVSLEKDSVLERIKTLGDALSPESIFQRFGNKYKHIESFKDKVSAETKEEISQFHDQTLSTLLSLVKKARIPLYVRRKRKDEIKVENYLVYEKKNLIPHIGFYRKENFTEYTLRLSNGARGKDFPLSNQQFDILSFQPGFILQGNTVYRLPEGFSARRLTPFLTKEKIQIPQAHEREYFKRFISKSLEFGRLDIAGFKIRTLYQDASAKLDLGKDEEGHPVFTLSFLYGRNTFEADDTEQSRILFKEKEDQFYFVKVFRKQEEETALLTEIRKEGLQSEDNVHFTLEGTADTPSSTWGQVIQWFTTHKKALYDKGIILSQQGMERPFYTGKWNVDQACTEDHDWFDLRIELHLDNGMTIPLLALRDNLLSGEREYRLPDGKVFLIPDEMFARYSGLLFFGRKTPSKHLLLQAKQAKGLIPDLPATQAQPATQPEPSTELHATLRPYQKKGFQWLYNLYRNQCGACLADDMGLGKTVETISFLLTQREETADTPPILIITPAALVHNWHNELQKFAPSFSVLVYKGIETTRRNKQKKVAEYNVILTSYQLLRNDIMFFSSRPFSVIVMDEAQLFKNRDSQLYKCISSLTANFKMALTGTPIENALSDLWTLMDVLNPGLLGSYSSFLKEYERPLSKNLADIRKDTLKQMVAPYILRRTKEEVLKDLPPLQQEIIICRMTAEQKTRYEEEVSKFRNILLEEETEKNKNTALVLQGLVHIRQIANHPALLDGGERAIERSGKLVQLFTHLENLIGTGHRALIFSDYVGLLDLVAEEMRRRQWKYSLLTGDTKDKEKAITDFTETDRPFFLVSLKAGGVGLNLTQADYVFLLDPWWNTAAEAQAVSRAHRMGQQHPVMVYRFVSEDTLEERILRIQDHKDKLVNAIIKQHLLA